MAEQPPDDNLESLAGTPEPSIIKEFAEFLGENKKWWLVPILVVIALFGLLMALSTTGAAPFIYTLF